MIASRAFQRAWLEANPADMTDDAAWGSYKARAGRYALLWSLYQGNAYNGQNLKQVGRQFDLYHHTREISNPFAQIVDFYATYVWGGYLDPAAGSDIKSAIPIATDLENIRPSIAAMWKASRFNSGKALVCRTGAIYGDVFLSVVDDPRRGEVRLQIVNPAHVADMDIDAVGNVKQLVISYQKTDDLNPNREVLYTERVTRNGDNVVWQLYKDSAPYAWNYADHTWELPYGFTPFVHIQHAPIGAVWGQSSAGNSVPLFVEVDELASTVDDQLRKLLNAPWLLSGVQEPATKPETSGDRADMPFLYAPDSGAKATALVANMPIGDAAAVFNQRMDTLRERFPELQIGNTGGGQVRSGDAERERHQAAGNQALSARAGYDEGLIRALQMGIAIGGWRGYKGYSGFDLNSYDAGSLEFSIAPRPVFQRSEAEQLDNVAKQAAIIASLVNAGGNVLQAALLAGMTEEDAAALAEVQYGFEQ